MNKKFSLQPVPTAWRPDPPLKITESFEDFTVRNEQNLDFFDSEQHPIEWWQCRWLSNQLEAAGELHVVNLDKGKRLENAQKIWELGRQYCWQESPVSFYIYYRILDYVGLTIQEN